MSIALFTFFLAVLAQLLGACYNYQFFNVLDVPLNVHPLTLEDNIQTALSQLTLFVTTTVLPPILGFTFRYHIEENIKSIPIKFELQKKLNERKSFQSIIKPLVFSLLCATVIFLIFCFLPFRIACYINAYIGFFFVLSITFDKIKKFSLKDDIAFPLFCLLYVGFLMFTYIHKGEIDGYKFKSDISDKYQLKIQDKQIEYTTCSNFRFFSNDAICLKNGKTTIIKKDLILEINVL